MSAIVLSTKRSKLMKVCEAEGFASIDDLLALVVVDSVCPAICMAEGCDHVAPMESDQEEGYCERCGSNTMAAPLTATLDQFGYYCPRCTDPMVDDPTVDDIPNGCEFAELLARFKALG
jgi:hypothetical protein